MTVQAANPGSDFYRYAQFVPVVSIVLLFRRCQSYTLSRVCHHNHCLALQCVGTFDIGFFNHSCTVRLACVINVVIFISGFCFVLPRMKRPCRDNQFPTAPKFFLRNHIERRRLLVQAEAGYPEIIVFQSLSCICDRICTCYFFAVRIH